VRETCSSSNVSHEPPIGSDQTLKCGINTKKVLMQRQKEYQTTLI